MVKNKLLVVYNTCGFSGREHVDWYIDCINNILNQDFEDFKVVVSSCGNSKRIKAALLRTFKNKVSYNFTNDRLTVNHTFNHTVQKCVEEFGEFEGYLYGDSGVNFKDNKEVLKKSYELFKSGPYGMVTLQANNDTGFKEWLDIDGTVTEENLEIPIGRACKDLVLEHLKSVDGAKSGFHHIGSRGDSTNNLFGNLDVREIVSDSEAWDSGFGYEEMQGVFFHDREKYDENGFVKDPERLKEFIRTRMFLDKSMFDYNNIVHKFVR